MNRLTLILGGARSGKSRFALEYGSRFGRSKVYIATALGLDPEMIRRIKQHRKDRPEGWKTIEEPEKLSDTLRSLEGKADVAVIDCLTLWLSNLLIKMPVDEKRIGEKLDELVATVDQINLQVVLVSNEVGLGIVPSDPLSRLFRDLAGVLHQRLARISGEVYWMSAGLPIKIKGERNEKTQKHS